MKTPRPQNPLELLPMATVSLPSHLPIAMRGERHSWALRTAAAMQSCDMEQ